MALFEDHLYTDYDGDLCELSVLAWRTITELARNMPSGNFSHFPAIIARTYRAAAVVFPGPCSLQELKKQLCFVMDNFTVLTEDVDAALGILHRTEAYLYGGPPDPMVELLTAYRSKLQHAEARFTAHGARCTWIVACVQLGSQ